MNKTLYPVTGPYAAKVAYSRAVKVTSGDTLYVSGALATDEAGNLMGGDDIGQQTRHVLKKIEAVLAQAGATFRHVVKVTIFAKDFARIRDIHMAQMEFFDRDHLPASTMIQVSGFVHPQALIEIECIAEMPDGDSNGR